jgi:hypothetical protein
MVDNPLWAMRQQNTLVGVALFIGVVLYLSAAESISRVPRPTLVIAFYMGLVEPRNAST